MLGDYEDEEQGEQDEELVEELAEEVVEVVEVEEAEEVEEEPEEQRGGNQHATDVKLAEGMGVNPCFILFLVLRRTLQKFNNKSPE